MSPTKPKPKKRPSKAKEPKQSHAGALVHIANMGREAASLRAQVAELTRELNARPTHPTVQAISRDRQDWRRKCEAAEAENERLRSLSIWGTSEPVGPRYDRMEAALARCGVLEEALRLLDPRNATALYERMADDFWHMTGMMAPGKSAPMEMNLGAEQIEQAEKTWRSWVGPWRERFFDAALAPPDSTTEKACSPESQSESQSESSPPSAESRSSSKEPSGGAGEMTPLQRLEELRLSNDNLRKIAKMAVDGEGAHIARAYRFERALREIARPTIPPDATTSFEDSFKHWSEVALDYRALAAAALAPPDMPISKPVSKPEECGAWEGMCFLPKGHDGGHQQHRHYTEHTLPKPLQPEPRAFCAAAMSPAASFIGGLLLCQLLKGHAGPHDSRAPPAPKPLQPEPKCECGHGRDSHRIKGERCWWVIGDGVECTCRAFRPTTEPAPEPAKSSHPGTWANPDLDVWPKTANFSRDEVRSIVDQSVAAAVAAERERCVALVREQREEWAGGCNSDLVAGD